MTLNSSPLTTTSTLVSCPSASFEQHAKNRLVINSYTRLSFLARLPACAVGWIGGCALSFLLPLRGVEKSPLRSLCQQSVHADKDRWFKKGRAGEVSIPSSKVAPFLVGSLLLNEGLEVKLRVELVRLCAGVREDSLLVKAFGYLDKHQVRGEHQHER